ncbi:hypothetical protein BX285_6719 [Streptomyces sp. 1114.5]|nr:hypothetical protein BX285_6719 [Streptomyces sp. 1114.5]
MATEPSPTAPAATASSPRSTHRVLVHTPLTLRITRRPPNLSKVIYSSVNYTTDVVTVSAPQVYFDPGYDAIDGDMTVGVNGVNYLYFKNNRNGTLLGARSTSLAPGSSTPFTPAVSHGGTEAPTVVKSLTSSTSWMWGDTYTPNGVFYSWQTTDLAVGTWTPLDQKTCTQSLNSKHCGITTVATAEYDNLLAKWGAPDWNRLKSYNFPTRYLRHSDYPCASTRAAARRCRPIALTRRPGCAGRSVRRPSRGWRSRVRPRSGG